MQNIGFTIAVLQELQEMGIQIAMDDFGIGLHCYLKRFLTHAEG